MTVQDLLDSCSQSDDRKIVQVVVDKEKGGLDEEREIKWLCLEMSISRLMQETWGELMLMVFDSQVVRPRSLHHSKVLNSTVRVDILRTWIACKSPQRFQIV